MDHPVYDVVIQIHDFSSHFLGLHDLPRSPDNTNDTSEGLFLYSICPGGVVTFQVQFISHIKIVMPIVDTYV